MCPLANPQVLLSLVVPVLFIVWVFIVPVYLIWRMEKIARLLEKKDHV